MALMRRDRFRLESMFHSSTGPRTSSAESEQCYDCYDLSHDKRRKTCQSPALAHALNLGTSQEVDRAVLAISRASRGAVLPVLCFK